MTTGNIFKKVFLEDRQTILERVLRTFMTVFRTKNEFLECLFKCSKSILVNKVIIQDKNSNIMFVFKLPNINYWPSSETIIKELGGGQRQNMFL